MGYNRNDYQSQDYGKTEKMTDEFPHGIEALIAFAKEEDNVITLKFITESGHIFTNYNMDKVGWLFFKVVDACGITKPEVEPRDLVGKSCKIVVKYDDSGKYLNVKEVKPAVKPYQPKTEEAPF